MVVLDGAVLGSGQALWACEGGGPKQVIRPESTCGSQDGWKMGHS